MWLHLKHLSDDEFFFNKLEMDESLHPYFVCSLLADILWKQMCSRSWWRRRGQRRATGWVGLLRHRYRQGYGEYRIPFDRQEKPDPTLEKKLFRIRPDKIRPLIFYYSTKVSIIDIIQSGSMDSQSGSRIHITQIRQIFTYRYFLNKFCRFVTKYCMSR